jgi:S-adenosyl-L-methionine hydrolase (adenosine-forming)
MRVAAAGTESHQTRFRIVDRRLVTFLSDYGTDDEFVGVCHAVIERIAPEAKVLDLSHGIPRHDVRQGAAVLANALGYSSPGVHMAIVDPGVGSTRKAVIVRTADDDRLLVGPDNGLLAPAIERFGGSAEAVDVSLSRVRLEPISATFHGRDVFAPVAARLAAGEPLAEAGPPLEPEELVRIELTRARVEDGGLVARVVEVDGFGNLALDARLRDLKGTDIRLGDPIAVRRDTRRAPGVFARTFADVERGGLLLYEDAGGALAVAINGGDAGRLLGARTGDELRVERT